MPSGTRTIYLLLPIGSQGQKRAACVESMSSIVDVERTDRWQSNHHRTDRL